MRGMRCGLWLICLVMTPSLLMSFDGSRKGFVMGGGIGYGPYTEWNWNDERDNETNPGLAGNFLIGYAWDNQNMLVFESNGNSMNFDDYEEIGTQIYVGPMWYHYFGNVGRSAFLSGGSLFYYAGKSDLSMGGLGFLFGGGYEFSKQVQAGLYFGHGWPNRPEMGYKIGTCNHINVLITVVAY